MILIGNNRKRWPSINRSHYNINIQTSIAIIGSSSSASM